VVTGDGQWNDVPADDVDRHSRCGRDIALYNAGGEDLRHRNTCTHGKRDCAKLSRGHEIECPVTRASSTFAPGSQCAPVTEAIRSYPVRIEGGRVFLALD